jgi:hypothetical protein
MSTNARTWFYSTPEPIAYNIAARVNETFWQARTVQLYWKCVHAEPPIKVVGYWDGDPAEMEWVPGEWLALKVPGDHDTRGLVQGVSTVLGLRPTFAYKDAAGREVTEWCVRDPERRWNDIQGKAAYQHPKRL